VTTAFRQPWLNQDNVSHFCSFATHIDTRLPIHSWRVLDVSVAMAYGMLTTYGMPNRSISAAAAILRGYNSIYPLTDGERKHLVLLIACRLACSVSLGAYSIQQNPANEYLLLHSEPAWKALELIWGHDAVERVNLRLAIDGVFQQACLYTDSRDNVVACFDLVMPDPTVSDLLYSVRVRSIFDKVPNPRKKRRISIVNGDGKPVITFVTGNAKKLEEVKHILGMDSEHSELPYHLLNESLDLPDLQGDPLSVAREKCRVAADKLDGAVLVEDTSLCFNALNGMPGVFIKWFLDSCGHEGLNQMLAGFDDKSGYAQTVVAFSPGPGHDPVLFDGRTTGKIVLPRGKLDFGWDPIFEPDEGGGKTYAEMSIEAKSSISHRSRALAQTREYLRKFQTVILTEMGESLPP
jgi:inosine triphosphate pyrophosphatase